MIETLIATLYCGENDYNECCKAIQSQTYKDFDHIIISNLPEVPAHKKLYESFKDNPQYKYLIKIDADIVLNTPDALQILVNAAKTKLKGIAPPLRVTADVDDYFTGILLQGIHLYSQKVTWDWNGFVDGCTTPDRLDSIHRNRSNRVCKLHQTLGNHCYHASEKQAFHFGYHRALKGQGDRCMDVWKNYCKKKDPLLWTVCVGIFTGLELKDFTGYCYNDRFESIYSLHSKRVVEEKAVAKAIMKFYQRTKH